MVTGAAGFLGSHLCDALIKKEYQVIGLDNLYTGRKENISHLLGNSNFSFVEHDVTIPIDLEVDGIFNMACPASPVQYQKNPVETIRTSFLGAYNLLSMATKNKAIILQASTSEVYGDPTQSPQQESYWGNVNPIGIRSCYDEGKRAAETLFFDFHREYETDIRVARIFNTYGPKMALDDGRVVSNFIVQALLGNDITIYGDGSQTRSFCYVDDLVDGLVRLYEKPGIESPINLGNPQPISISTLAAEIIEMTNSKSRIILQNLPQDDPVMREPDISLARNYLGWNPTVDRNTGLLKTVSYFSDQLGK